MYLKIKKTCIKDIIFNYMQDKHPYFTSINAGVTHKNTRKPAKTFKNAQKLLFTVNMF